MVSASRSGFMQAPGDLISYKPKRNMLLPLEKDELT